MTDAKTREQLEKEWWDAWWAEDYSWEGLEKREIGGDGGLHDEKTLQDYWRRDPDTGALRDDEALKAAGELVEGPDKRLWHIVHLPLKGKDGAATWKWDLNHPDWEWFEKLLTPRVKAGVETKLDFVRRAEGRDGRVLLSGAVLRSVPGHPDGKQAPLHLDFWRTVALGQTDCRSQVFGGCLFSGSRFVGATQFDGASFVGVAQFDGASFVGTAEFDGASFSEHARFANASFSASAQFDGAGFSGDANFNGASFAADARFANVNFGGSAGFAGASFGGAARFGNTNFAAIAQFANAGFSKVAQFGGAQFSGTAGFDGASFAGTARFDGTTFHDVAQFAGVNFGGSAIMSFATFHKDAWFAPLIRRDERRRSVFSKLADFDSVMFKAPARFGEAEFAGRMKFDKALFEAIADFSKMTVPGSEADWRGAFDGVLFQRVLDLRGVDSKAVSLIAGSTLDRGILLERTGENEEARAHAQALKLARTANDSEMALKALESGALKLKLAMESESDTAREQRFYRLELRARRKQRKTKASEKFFSVIYAAVSNYGASIGRPFAALTMMIVLFAAGFWVWGYSIGAVQPLAANVSLLVGPPVPGPGVASEPVPDDALIDPAEAVWGALEFSWSNVFQPLSALSTENDYLDRNPLASRLLYADGGAIDMKGFLVRVAATFQSLFAIVLAFLVALAVRRKFQIS